MISIDKNSSIAEIIEKYKKDHSFSLSLDVEEQDLIEMIMLHKNQIYTDAFFETIIAYPTVTEKVYELLLELCDKKSDSIPNAIATSGKATEKILLRLLKHESKFVKEHVRLALFDLQLHKTSNDNFMKLYNNYKSENDEFNCALRYTMAVCKNAPIKILNKLANDDYDHVAKAAKENLLQKANKKMPG